MNKLLEKKISLRLLIVPLLLLVAIAFMADACSNQTTNSNNSAQNATNKWGYVNLTNYYEYEQMKEIYQERDNTKLVLNAYLFSQVTGKLTCLGEVKGFGIPYGTQISPPNDPSQGSVPEPNGLYPSSSTNADWVQLIDPKTGQVSIAFVEPDLVITSQSLPCLSLGS